MLAPYDQAQWPNGSIFDDFLAMLGIESAGFDTAVQVEAANRSLPPALLEVLRISNRLDLAPEKTESLYRRAIRGMGFCTPTGTGLAHCCPTMIARRCRISCARESISTFNVAMCQHRQRNEHSDNTQNAEEVAETRVVRDEHCHS
jgi:hypothetical protein